MIGTLLFHQIKGAILIGIALLAIVSWTTEHNYPSAFIQWPYPQMSVHDFLIVNIDEFDLPKMIPAIVAFMFIGIIDVSGVVYGMASLGKIHQPVYNILVFFVVLFLRKLSRTEAKSNIIISTSIV